MKSALSILPNPVVRRLPRYLTHVRELRRADLAWVSSRGLAEALGLTSSTVRQDLSHLSLAGVSKRGYETRRLEEVLREELDGRKAHRLVIVGAGYLGCALALHGDLAEHRFETCGIFDNDVAVIGTQVGKLRVKPMSLLRGVVQGKGVEIGIIAVPAHAAQEVADRLVLAGIRGIVNLAYVHLRVPRRVAVVDSRILASLQELAYAIKTRHGAT